MKTTKDSEVRPPVLVVDENMSLEEQIARRAHELWQQRGREHGSDLADWLQAEREVNEWHQKRPKAKASRRSASIPSGVATNTPEQLETLKTSETKKGNKLI